MNIGRFDRLKLMAHALSGKKQQRLVISLWHEFYRPPYGGGNQFMLAIKDAFEKRGHLVVCNIISPRVDVHLCNSAWFDIDLFERSSRKYPVKMIHRIDGPVSLYRGEGMAEDTKIHNINKRFASATVYQSRYCMEKSQELGLRAVNPSVISNSVNSSIFHSRSRLPFASDRKVRIISSAWSDNPLKGGPLYKWLDTHLDWDRFEYTFVGRVQQTFENIRHIPPQSSEGLAEQLRQHDIFLSASQHEPCSNALMEALSCGLPAVYRNTGGNPELVGKGGLPFADESDVLVQLDKVVTDYQAFRDNIVTKSIDEIAESYLEVARNICKGNPEMNPAGNTR